MLRQRRNHLIIIIVLLFASFIYTAETQAFDGVFVKGVVARSPWQNDHIKIKVDRVTYIILTRCRFLRQHKTGTGAYQEKLANLEDIQNGARVLMRVHGNRVSEIIIVDEGV